MSTSETKPELKKKTIAVSSFWAMHPMVRNSYVSGRKISGIRRIEEAKLEEIGRGRVSNTAAPCIQCNVTRPKI